MEAVDCPLAGPLPADADDPPGDARDDVLMADVGVGFGVQVPDPDGDAGGLDVEEESVPLVRQLMSPRGSLGARRSWVGSGGSIAEGRRRSRGRFL